MKPATRNRAPDIQMGTEVVRLAYNAMMGAYMESPVVIRFSLVNASSATHHYTEDAIRSCGQSVPRSSILSGEQLGRDRVQDPIHHLRRGN